MARVVLKTYGESTAERLLLRLRGALRLTGARSVLFHHTWRHLCDPNVLLRRRGGKQRVRAPALCTVHPGARGASDTGCAADGTVWLVCTLWADARRHRAAEHTNTVIAPQPPGAVRDHPTADRTRRSARRAQASLSALSDRAA
jgi:hypothetical protein